MQITEKFLQDYSNLVYEGSLKGGKNKSINEILEYWNNALTSHLKSYGFKFSLNIPTRLEIELKIRKIAFNIFPEIKRILRFRLIKIRFQILQKSSIKFQLFW